MSILKKANFQSHIHEIADKKTAYNEVHLYNEVIKLSWWVKKTDLTKTCFIGIFKQYLFSGRSDANDERELEW
jgi:hypothetical protein